MNADEYSIFSTILADIEESPTILEKKKKNLSNEFSIFSTTDLADIDEENLTILQNKEQEKNKTQIDFTCTVPQTLTRSDLLDLLNQELAVLKSEIETVQGQASDRFVSPNPNYDRKSVREEEEVKYLADEVSEWLSRGDEVFIDTAEDSVSIPKPEDGENLKAFDEEIDGILEKIEKDGSYLERVKQDYVFGDILQELVMKILREKADKEEKEISSWMSNGEEPEETETGVAEEEKRRSFKKKSPVKRTEQESTVSKRDCFGYKRRLYLIEKLRERDENLMNMRMKAARFGVDFSFLVAEYTFLTANELLASEIEDYWICLMQLGVNEDDKGTSVIIGKLKEVFEIVMRKKKEIKVEHHNVKNLPESIFRFEDYILHCADAIGVLGKIVFGLRRNNGSDDRVKLSRLVPLFEDCEKVLMKIELKLAGMKQCFYRSVSADYESFAKTERFDSLLREKVVNRVNADNGFGRSVIGSYLVEIWKSLFQHKAGRSRDNKNEERKKGT